MRYVQGKSITITVALVTFIVGIFLSGAAVDSYKSAEKQDTTILIGAPADDDTGRVMFLQIAISGVCQRESGDLPGPCRIAGNSVACAQLDCQAGLDGPLSEAARGYHDMGCDLIEDICGFGSGGGGGGGGGGEADGDPPCTAEFKTWLCEFGRYIHTAVDWVVSW